MTIQYIIFNSDVSIKLTLKDEKEINSLQNRTRVTSRETPYQRPIKARATMNKNEGRGGGPIFCSFMALLVVSPMDRFPNKGH